MVDPNGEFGVPGAFVGAIIGAVANSAAYALTAGEDFNALGLAANAVEGLVVGATIGSGAGIVTTLAVGAVQNVGTELISDAGASAKAGEARGIYASETAVDAVSNVLGDAAQGAAAAGVGKALAGPVGSRVSAAAAEVGEALTSAGSKAYGPALGATAPAIGQAAGNAPGATVDVIFDDAQDEINR